MPYRPVTAHTAGAIAYQLASNAIRVAANTPIEGKMPTIIQVVYLDCREATSLPYPGTPLFVGNALEHHDGNLYRGVALPAAAPRGEGHFAGIVWQSQPVQRLAHRQIASIAVCVEGAVRVYDPNILALLEGPPGTAALKWGTTFVKVSDDGLVCLLQ